MPLFLAACGSSSSSSTPLAASVNGQGVPQSTYHAQLFMDEIAYSDANGYNPCAIDSMKSICDQIKRGALTTVIGHAYIRQYAAQHGLRLSKADIARSWADAFRVHFHSNQAAFNAWSRRTGIPESEFRASVEADQLQSLVLYEVTKNVSPFAPALKLSRIVAANKAEESQVLALMRVRSFDGTANFLRRTSKKGCGHVQCGVLGWIPYNLLPADGVKLEHKPVGTVIGPVHYPQGFDFLKIEGRSPRYPLTAHQYYLLREKVFGEWLLNRLRHAQVKRFVAV